MKILVCEDDRLMQQAIHIVLEREGFEIIQAFDGNEAIEQVENHTFDLILIDIHLPYNSGLEVIKHLRHVIKSQVPVVVVSAISNYQIQDQAASLGINKYIVKPINPKELARIIKDILNQ